MGALNPPPIDFGFAVRALDAESGDVCLARPFPGGLLVGVLDGLGHGPAARLAARRGAALLESRAGEPLDELVHACHGALRDTRGAAVSLASFDVARGRMAWLSVGNVAGVLLRAAPGAHPRREGLVLRGGVVGVALPPLLVSELPVARGDLLLLATDGVRDGFEDDIRPREAPRVLADRILGQHGKSSDDALVLVARYLGNGM